MDRRTFLTAAAAAPLALGTLAGCTFEKVDRTGGGGSGAVAAGSSKLPEPRREQDRVRGEVP